MIDRERRRIRMRAYRIIYRRRNPERVSAHEAAYRDRNRTKILARKRTWYAEHREQERARHRARPHSVRRLLSEWPCGSRPPAELIEAVRLRGQLIWLLSNPQAFAAKKRGLLPAWDEKPE